MKAKKNISIRNCHPTVIKKYVLSLSVLEYLCGYERAADDDDDGEFISDISDTICIFKWLSLSTNHKILLIMSL